MIYKIVFALACLMVLVDSNPRTTPYELIPLEEPCVRQGGICVRAEDCEPGNLVNIAVVLCPMQNHLGAECCYL